MTAIVREDVERWPKDATRTAVLALLDERDVLLAAEGRDAARLWTCPACAFAFDAMHTDANGSHSCPACAELKLRDTIDAMTKATAEQRAIDEQTLRVAGEQVEAARATSALHLAAAERAARERDEYREWPCESDGCDHTLADVLAHDASHPRPTSGGAWFCAACWNRALGKVIAERDEARASWSDAAKSLSTQRSYERALKEQAEADLTLCRAQLLDAQETASRAAAAEIAAREALRRARPFVGWDFPPRGADPTCGGPCKHPVCLTAREIAALLAQPSPSAALLAARDAKVFAAALRPIEAAAIAVMAEYDEETTGDPLLDNLLNEVLAAANRAGLNTPIVRAPRPAPAPTVAPAETPPPRGTFYDLPTLLAAEREQAVAPAAGEAKRCETCGGSGTVQPPSLGMVGIQMGIDYTPMPCPDCTAPSRAPEKGGAR